MKKRKLKVKKVIILLLLLLISGVIVYFFINANFSNSTKTEYSDEAEKVLNELNLYDSITDKEFSETLENVLVSKYFNEIYLDEYYTIKYIDSNNFIKNIHQYLDKGYSGDEINIIYTLSLNNQKLLIQNEYLNFMKYSEYKNFNVENFDRYESYLDIEDDIENVITYVNIGLDKEFYTNIIEVYNPSDIDVLINKYYKLPDYYEPDDLVTLSGYYGSIRIKKDAGEKFTEMINDALDDGFEFVATTAYRDYDWQNTLYTNYVASDGQSEADTYSARAGHSEHQTGYAVDVANPDYYEATGTRLNDDDYKWILENSYKYGFIVRYPKDSTHITTYMEEPWHLRYFGVELATNIIKSNLTYDEYYDLHIREY